jgi:bifunctional oligoribonuclease and PAP phosphatase NrnA
MTPETDMAAVVEAIRSGHRFLVTSHESPDGDALGSLLAMHLALLQIGKDSVMALVGPAPLPGEYRFLDLEGHGLRRDLPADASERVLLAVDCAQETRLTDVRLLDSRVVVNVDHHHDNTRFGTVNLVAADASSTAEMLADVLRALGIPLTPEIAEALYAGLVTDTGRFQYANTTPKALRLAAELLEAGADIQRIFQGVYESMQFAKAKLLARALDRATMHEEGRVVVSFLLRSDFGEVGAAEPYSEGIIDVLRSVEGAELAALIREPLRDGTAARKVSLRSSNDRIDVSAIARGSGGGGHRQAAGFSSDLSIPEITAYIVSAFAAIPAVHA